MRLKLNPADFEMLLFASGEFVNSNKYLESGKIIKCLMFDFFQKKHVAKYYNSLATGKPMTITFSLAEIVAFDRILSDYKPANSHFEALKNIIHPIINKACLSI